MFRFNITDRRLNPHGKSLNNRQRFVERVKGAVKAAATKQIKNRSLQDKSDAEVSVSKEGIEEENFHYSSDRGHWDHVLPGNQDYNVGDTINRPKERDGGGGSEGSVDGEGEDDFRFYISYEEYINAILDDLSLPDMIKASNKQTISYTMRRAGYTTVGAASNLALERTMVQGIGRRMALKAPKLAEIAALEQELAETDDAFRIAAIEEEIAGLRRRADAICFLEKTDLRYNNFVKQPQPITRCVMTCVMDVSGSMTENMKELAKRFYLLLYVFLTRQYKDVDIVFIRHTHVAKEVDQDEFFNSPETGGTVVSAAYKVVKEIIEDRYDVNEWNIYMAQASDGDNSGGDADIARKLLTAMLPWFQYVTYIEVGSETSFNYIQRDSDVWTMFKVLADQNGHVAQRKLKNQNDVISVFRSLFEKKKSAA